MLKAIILAAGKGTRMESEKPKVVHKVLEKPMVYYSIEAARKAGCEQICVIVGYKSDEVKESISETYRNEPELEKALDNISYVFQEEQLGTGHAVKCAADFIGTGGDVVILCGDTPLVTEKTFEKAVLQHKQENNGVTVISAILDEPFGYGRIIRDEKGLSKIVEQKDATPQEQAVHEVNSGMYIFKCDALLRALFMLTNDNIQGEYYLTDTIEIIKNMGLSVDAVAMEDADQIKGVNTLEQLAEAEDIMKKRWM